MIGVTIGWQNFFNQEVISMTRIAFVSGDLGGANLIKALLPKLREQNIGTTLLCDSEGMGKNALAEFDPLIESVWDDLIQKMIEQHDLIAIGTCASAWKLEVAVASEIARTDLPVKAILLSDGFYNMALPHWQDFLKNPQYAEGLSKRFYLCAIHQNHARHLANLCPQIPPAHIIVTGQPAFDSAITLMPRAQEIRASIRKKLAIENSTVLLWWSQGMAELIGDDLVFISQAIFDLSSRTNVDTPPNPAIIISLHPKLNTTVRPGFTNEVFEQLAELGRQFNVRIIPRPDVKEFPEEELNLAADIVAAITSTADIKLEMMGLEKPVVIHWADQGTRTWFETHLHLADPYLIENIAERALFVREPDGLRNALREALKPETQKRLLKNYSPPACESFVAQTITTLKELVS